MAHLLNSLLVVVWLVIYTGAQLDFGGPIEAPDYSEVPKGLLFSCKNRIPGYYADVSARCQVWHWCLPSGAKYSFLCPKGTVFNQNFRVCDWYSNVDCETSEARYDVNADLYRRQDGTYI